MWRVLTIAGSDSGGGAGLQADLKTFTVLGAYGASVVTAVTAQNTTGVKEVYPLPAAFVGIQLEAVLEDFTMEALKIGMLATGEIVEVVAAKLAAFRVQNLVVDPVLAAKDGTSLLEPAAVGTLKTKLLPQAKVVTPNLPEAEILAEMKISNPAEIKEAARRIFRKGVSYVLIKGGHGGGKEATDLLYDGRRFFFFPGPRLKSSFTHGGGCTFSAALTVYLAQGLAVPAAVNKAKIFVAQAIFYGFPVGKGWGVVNPLWKLKK